LVVSLSWFLLLFGTRSVIERVRDHLGVGELAKTNYFTVSEIIDMCSGRREGVSRSPRPSGSLP